MLIGEGCSVTAFDPAAMKRTKQKLPEGPNLRYVGDAYSAATNADALLILTDWSEFAALDRLYAAMRYPIVVAGRNLYEPAVMFEHGFTYISVGRPAVYPAPRAPSPSAHSLDQVVIPAKFGSSLAALEA
jgi:UDPglucose 6-dehydrogenase